MQRLTHAPNIAIAQLWADALCALGVQASVQRFFLSSIAGDLPPDQCQPEIWVMDDAQLELARQHLGELQHRPQRHWVCAACNETIDGGFEQCWNCGAMLPGW